MQMYSQTINLTHEFKSCVQMTKHFAMVKNQCQCRKANPLVLGHCIFKTGTKLQTATARDFYLEGEVSEKKSEFSFTVSLFTDGANFWGLAGLWQDKFFAAENYAWALKKPLIQSLLVSLLVVFLWCITNDCCNGLGGGATNQRSCVQIPLKVVHSDIFLL